MNSPLRVWICLEINEYSNYIDIIIFEKMLNNNRLHLEKIILSLIRND